MEQTNPQTLSKKMINQKPFEEMAINKFKTLGLLLEKVEWKEDAEDFNNGRISLFIFTDTHPHRLPIKKINLEDKDGLGDLKLLLDGWIEVVKSNYPRCNECDNILQDLKNVFTGNQQSNYLYGTCMTPTCSQMENKVDVTTWVKKYTPSRRGDLY